MQPRRRLARNVRRLRVEAGLSQEAVAADTGLMMAHVSRIERAVANPTLDVLVRLSRALSADISALFEGVDARAPAPQSEARQKGQEDADRTPLTGLRPENRRLLAKISALYFLYVYQYVTSHLST